MATMLAIGWRARQRWSSSNEYLNASRSLSLWTTALAFLAYNCGSIEVMGMSAMAAQYGVQALHFYWIGGIPGLIFLALVLLPIYRRTGANTLPEYLGMRFGPHVRLLNACIALMGTICFAGVALYTMGEVLHVILGWQFLEAEMICAGVVLVYVLVGGARGSIVTSVFQLFVMIAGLAPLLFLTVRFDRSSWAQRPERWHLWKPLPMFSPHAPLDCIGVLLGLAFAISFSYWCTDFVMIQRVLAARTMEDARKAPLLAGFGKMGIAFLVVLPGVAAPRLLQGRFSFDQTIPALMRREYGPALLALGAAALLAGLMAWLAGNVSGFCAIWVGEIYRARLRPNRAEAHYLRMGKAAVPVCLGTAQLAAFATFHFQDMMEFLQFLAALFYVPVFAVILCGVVSRRSSGRGAFAGICGGFASALALQFAFLTHVVRFGSQMNANFYEAMLSFATATLICMAMRESHEREFAGSAGELQHAALWQDLRPSRSLVLLSAALLAACFLLNVLWW
jgi:SSS family solute:Na+ symporter